MSGVGCGTGVGVGATVGTGVGLSAPPDRYVKLMTSPIPLFKNLAYSGI